MFRIPEQKIASVPGPAVLNGLEHLVCNGVPIVCAVVSRLCEVCLQAEFPRSDGREESC